MAVVAHTEVTKKLPVGDRVQQTFSVLSADITAKAANEWIATGLSWIDTVVGITCFGTLPWSDTATTVDPVDAIFLLNAQGTGGTAGNNPGDLGIELPTATPVSVHITVIGRP